MNSPSEPSRQPETTPQPAPAERPLTVSRRAFLRRTSTSALRAVGGAAVAVGLSEGYSSGHTPTPNSAVRGICGSQPTESVCNAVEAAEPAASASSSSPTRTELAGLIAPRRLGRTELLVHPIGFGAGSLNPSRAELLRAALSAGINLIDTSPAYGEGASEETVGRVLSQLGSAVRDRVVLVTKEPGLDWERLATQSDAAVRRLLFGAVEGSLRRLRTDRIEVLALPAAASRAEQSRVPDNVRRALDQLRSAGKVRFFGLATSEHAAADTARAAMLGGFYDVVLTVLNAATLDSNGRFRNLVNRVVAHARQTANRQALDGRRSLPPVLADDASDLPRLAAEHDVGLLAMRAAHTRFIPAELDATVRRSFGRPGLSRHQALYQAVLAHPEIAAVLVGVQTADHVREAVSLASQAKLPYTALVPPHAGFPSSPGCEEPAKSSRRLFS